MGEPNRRKLNRAIVEARRRRVAALKLRGLSAREIQATLADLSKKAMLNPHTGKAYSLGTIGSDLVALQKRWREEAAKDIREHKARELAELWEHRKSAWGQRELGEVRLGIALEMKLLGSEAPVRVDVKDVTDLSDTEAGRRLLALAVAAGAEALDAGLAKEQRLPEDVSE